MAREIPLFTLTGVPDAEVAVHPFSTQDRLGLTLTRFRRPGNAADVILLVPGLTQSSDMFIMPEHYNLVRYLLDSGFNDVWCLDGRMSNHFPYNNSGTRYTLDDVALFDHPAALAEMRRHIGERPVHAIAHCLGAASLTMALAAKTVTGVASAICNAVTLTPRVPAWSRLKLAVVPNVMEYALSQPYASPQWGEAPTFSLGKTVSRLADAAHGECDVPACHMLSLMWGAGNPALYEHANISDVTHRRIGDLHGPTGFQYHRHVAKCVEAGAAVKYDAKDARYDALPANYLFRAAAIETPLLLVAGAHNHVFADSNPVCFEALEKATPGRHALQMYEAYGHNDVFMGVKVHEDIFPSFSKFLDAQRARIKAA
jgi:lysosomal acid lipase/cholesteryl ester hydrolase